MDDVIHILVIDDDAEMRELFVRILLPGGHQVIAVGSAEEGLELLPYHTFGVAFLDHNLPGMEGLVLGEYLRKNNPQMEIALVTGSNDRRLERLGAQHSITYIEKPFQVSQILDVVTAFQKKVQQGQADHEALASEDFELALGAWFEELPGSFELAGAPKRIEERLLQVTRAALLRLRSDHRFNERDRAVAFAGIMTLQVLGFKGNKASSPEALAAEYDELMRHRNKRTSFDR